MGSTANFNVEITQSLTGAQFTHVPFKGGEAVVTALLGGHVEVTYDIVGKFMPHVEAGKLRLLLVSRKVSSLPNLPRSRNWVMAEIFSQAGMPCSARRGYRRM